MNTKYLLTLFLVSSTFLAFSQSSSKLETLIQKLEQSTTSKKPPILIEIAKIYWEAEKHDTTFKYLKQAQSIAQKTGNKIALNQAYYELGDCYRIKGLYPKAIAHYKKAITKNNDSEMVANANNRIGVCHYYTGDYNESLQYYLKSLRYYESIKDTSLIARQQSNIGYIHMMTKNYNKALQYFEKAANIYQLPDISAVGEAGVVKLVVRDKKNDTSHKFDIEVGETNSDFVFNFKEENLKILPGTYDVVVSSKLLSRFTSQNHDLCYYIALEPDSTFGR